jgi:hypothetical protein
MQSEVPSPRTQEPVTIPHPETYESSPRAPSFFKIRFESTFYLACA